MRELKRILGQRHGLGTLPKQEDHTRPLSGGANTTTLSLDGSPVGRARCSAWRRLWSEMVKQGGMLWRTRSTKLRLKA